MTVTQPEAEPKSSALDLLTPDEANSVASLVIRDNPEITDLALALSIVDEALKFVAAAAKHPADPAVRPSRRVDMGWHALILHTTIYVKLCQGLGRFVHHVPEGPETRRPVAVTQDDSIRVIREMGYEPNLDLWGGVGDAPLGGDCHTECNVECNSCTNPGFTPSPPLPATA
ncbi:hypothetical protein [Streptomyces sp. MH60]|uniref:hypothetical protein n=1 Tax=Streptomyces sp. MH60 TaxID=1940758 RepID=UPI000D4292A2|nr:hypothetical protein [Streptomyces sp. MH60]PPS89555.1 hypothetical protein BZZ08_01702 [Streptomyces sp. MH60]